jgi:hypothetical protein
MSMASDTLSIELVRQLLPEEWFNLLDNLRSLRGVMGDDEVPYAKFSSMGNGFTFQLESMIFYALTLAVAKHLGFPLRDTDERCSNIAVYGDDIIVPAGMALVLVDVLAFTGFKLNDDKSFLFGPFRESCGTDWFEGRDVRPLFLKRIVKNAKDIIFVSNCSSRADHITGCLDSDGVIRGNLTRYCLRRIPAILRDILLGPVTKDLEGHIHLPWDLAQRSRYVIWGRRMQQYLYKSIKSRAIEFSAKDGPILLQLMDYNGCRGDHNDDMMDGGENTRSHNRMMLLLSLEECQTVSAPLNAGTVYRRKATRSVLTTQVSNGWRNS